MAEIRLCNSDLEGLIDYYTVEARWTVVSDPAVSFGCKVGIHLLPDFVLLFVLTRLSVDLGEVVEEAVDTLSLVCGYPKLVGSVLSCSDRNQMCAVVVTVWEVPAIVAKEACWSGLDSIG